MPHTSSKTQNLQRTTLLKLAKVNGNQLIPLRLEYSEKSKLLTSYINKLVDTDRIYPRHLPTQASGRWSTLGVINEITKVKSGGNITNWPRACVEPACQYRLQELYKTTRKAYIEHEWTDACWSLRDMIQCDKDEVMSSWDHDNIEGKIHDLIVNDEVAIKAHREGYDLHTLTCCDIFGYDYPTNCKNPHSSTEDSQWRSKYNWQGKDTKQRVLAKNFNHGSKYTESYRFVHRIQGIEQYGISYKTLENLAKRFIDSKKEAWERKLQIMEVIRRNRISRSLYGFRRIFYDSSPETGREGFSHMISATVSDYNNKTLIMLENMLGDSVRLLHNAHDGDKIAIKKDSLPSNDELLQVIQRPIEYQARQLVMTAGVKVTYP